MTPTACQPPDRSELCPHERARLMEDRAGLLEQLDGAERMMRGLRRQIQNVERRLGLSGLDKRKQNR